MRPLATASSNFVWRGPTPEIGDLHAHIDRTDEVMQTTTVWEPTPDERERIARGENVALRVLGMHPPVLLFVTPEQGVGEDDPAVRARLRELVKGKT